MSTLSCLGAVVLAVSTLSFAADKPKVLLYTKQGKTLDGKQGFVHNNVKAATESIQKMAADNNFAVDCSEDPAVFTADNLKQYKALIFCNSNNQILDTDAQQKAFQDYIRGGGGFVGIHSATGSMRGWAWFADMIGGRFDSPSQAATLQHQGR